MSACGCPCLRGIRLPHAYSANSKAASSPAPEEKVEHGWKALPHNFATRTHPSKWLYEHAPVPGLCGWSHGHSVTVFTHADA